MMSHHRRQKSSGGWANRDFAVQLLLRGASIDGRLWMRLGVSRLDRNVRGRTGSWGLKATMGTALGILPEDVVHSRYILLWGLNPMNTNPHVWPFIEEAKSAGPEYPPAGVARITGLAGDGREGVGAPVREDAAIRHQDVGRNGAQGQRRDGISNDCMPARSNGCMARARRRPSSHDV